MANISPDDALEEDREDKEVAELINPRPQLPEDGATPAAAADDNQIVPPDHPITDSNLDKSEVYDEGVGSAANLDEADENTVPNKDDEANEYKF